MEKIMPPAAIQTFEEYVEIHCKNTTIESANEYANKGQAFLERLKNNELTDNDKKSSMRAENMAYVQWLLFQQSYANEKSFGKGTFTLRLESDQQTQELFEYFKNDTFSLFPKSAEDNPTVRAAASALMTGVGFYTSILNGMANTVGLGKQQPTYSRTSSHFNNRLVSDGHFGIDAKFSDIPLPWKFQTSAFALIEDPTSKELSVYIKPETEGADTLRNFYGSIVHGLNFFKSTLLKPGNVVGVDRFAESNISKDEKKEIEAILLAIGMTPTKIKSKNFDTIFDNIERSKEFSRLEKLEMSKKLQEYIMDKYENIEQQGNELPFKFGTDGMKLHTSKPTHIHVDNDSHTITTEPPQEKKSYNTAYLNNIEIQNRKVLKFLKAGSRLSDNINHLYNKCNDIYTQSKQTPINPERIAEKENIPLTDETSKRINKKIQQLISKKTVVSNKKK